VNLIGILAGAFVVLSVPALSAGSVDDPGVQEHSQGEHFKYDGPAGHPPPSRMCTPMARILDRIATMYGGAEHKVLTDAEKALLRTASGIDSIARATVFRRDDSKSYFIVMADDKECVIRDPHSGAPGWTIAPYEFESQMSGETFETIGAD
jgi:hypothetical protein